MPILCRKSWHYYDYEMLEEKTRTAKPKLIICGASAYVGILIRPAFEGLPMKLMRLYCDVTPARLIAKGLLSSPFDDCHLFNFNIKR